jgi:scyllo-inositol 2-dehydrogenase (NADP+)
MNPFKWGMIGSVARAKAFSSETSFTSTLQCLHALLPSNDGEVELLETLPEITIYSNISDLLQSGIDAVYVASPHNLHYKQVKLCLETRTPVLCERPVADTFGQLADLVALSERYQTFFMEALWLRFMPVVRKVLSVISSGLIGSVVSVRASVHYRSGISVLPPDTDIGGGALSELGTFPIFLTSLLLGRPAYIKALGKLDPTGEDEDFSAFLSYDGGQYAFIEASVTSKMDSFIDICGDRGNIYIKNPWSAKPEGLKLDLADGTKMVHKSEWKGIGLYFEMDEVQTCIQKGLIESPYYSHQFTLDVNEVVDRIREQLIT